MRSHIDLYILRSIYFPYTVQYTQGQLQCFFAYQSPRNRGFQDGSFLSKSSRKLD